MTTIIIARIVSGELEGNAKLVAQLQRNILRGSSMKGSFVALEKTGTTTKLLSLYGKTYGDGTSGKALSGVSLSTDAELKLIAEIEVSGSKIKGYSEDDLDKDYGEMGFIGVVVGGKPSVHVKTAKRTVYVGSDGYTKNSKKVETFEAKSGFKKQFGTSILIGIDVYGKRRS